jgi:Domain of unknown function (DUF4375)
MHCWPENLGVTADQFDSMEADALMENIGAWMSGAFETNASNAPQSIRLGGAAYRIWGDVGNGGLYQYLYNSAPGLGCAVEALQVLCRHDAATIMARAIGMLAAPEMVEDWTARRRFVEHGDFEERLADLDDTFWPALNEDTFFDDLAKYVRGDRVTFVPYFNTAAP